MKKELNKYAFILIDVILINLAYVLSLYIRFEGVIEAQFLNYFSRYLNNAIFITII